MPLRVVRGGSWWFVVVRGGSWWFVVVRGGSWNNNANNCRSANCNRNAPGNQNNKGCVGGDVSLTARASRWEFTGSVKKESRAYSSDKRNLIQK